MYSIGQCGGGNPLKYGRILNLITESLGIMLPLTSRHAVKTNQLWIKKKKILQQKRISFDANFYSIDILWPKIKLRHLCNKKIHTCLLSLCAIIFSLLHIYILITQFQWCRVWSLKIILRYCIWMYVCIWGGRIYTYVCYIIKVMIFFIIIIFRWLYLFILFGKA